MKTWFVFHHECRHSNAVKWLNEHSHPCILSFWGICFVDHQCCMLKSTSRALGMKHMPWRRSLISTSRFQLHPFIHRHLYSQTYTVPHGWLLSCYGQRHSNRRYLRWPYPEGVGLSFFLKKGAEGNHQPVVNWHLPPPPSLCDRHFANKLKQCSLYSLPHWSCKCETHQLVYCKVSWCHLMVWLEKYNFLFQGKKNKK